MLTLLTNANLYTPTALGKRHLLIGGGKILAICQQIPQLDDNLSIDYLDLDGAIVTPGFIDGHAHLIGGGGESGPASRVPPVDISSMTLAGVTSVVGLLGTDDLTKTTQSLVTQAYGLRELGLSAWCYTGGYHLPLMTLTSSARSDIVNLDPVIGVGELAISDHRSSQPTIDELLRVASETHVAGLMTGKAGILHCHMGDGARGLELIRAAISQSEIPARVFNPTHVNRNQHLFEQALSLSKKGCYIDLTAFPDGHFTSGYSAVEAVLRYRAAGADTSRLTISSDGGGCLPLFDGEGHVCGVGVGDFAILADNFRRLVGEGMTLEEVLPLFTSNVARLLRLKGKGELQVAADADLLVLDEQLQIQHVMANGRWHVKQGHALVHGPFQD